MKKSALVLLALVGVAVLCAGLVHAIDPVAAKTSLAGDVLAMAVVAKYGTGSRDPSSLLAIAGIFAAAEARTIVSQIAITNGDSIASTFRIGELPADAIIDPDSAYDFEAVAGVTDLDVGFRYPNGGAVIDADNLVDGDDVSSAGSQTLKGHATLTTANGHKRAWELAGLTSNPGGNLEIYATLNAASTATKVINFRIRYFKGA